MPYPTNPSSRAKLTTGHRKLGEVCEISAGGSAPQGKRFFEGGKYPFFRTFDVGMVHLSENLCDTRDYLNNEGIKKLRLFKTGTILFPKSGASTFLNHRVIMGCDGYVASHLATIVAGKNIDNRYLYFFLILIDARNIAPNSSYPSLRISDIAKIEIPLPPIAEQKKIVARLEKLLGKIKEAKRLREEAQSASAGLLPAELHKIFEEGEKWEETNIQEVTELVTKGTTPKTLGYAFTESGIPFLKAENVNGGEVNASSTRTFISKQTHDILSRSKTKVGDVLMTIAGTIGRIGWIPDDAPEMNMNQAVAIIRPRQGMVFTPYLAYVLSAGITQGQVGSGIVKAAIPNFSLGMIKKLKIPLPPIAEQKRIVARLDSLSEKLSILREAQDKTASDLALLGQLVLSRAFSDKI